jgi:hypothetical protein
MNEERRGARRYVLWIPVQVKSGPDIQLLAVSRNVSGSGALLIAGASLDVGGRVELTLSVPGAPEDRQLGGEIVRVETNEDDPDGLWRYRLAVRFDDEVPELVPHFEALEAKARG